MKVQSIVLTVLVGVGLGCSHTEKEGRRPDQNSAAFKVGKAAHEVAKDTGKVAAAAGRKIGESARKAEEGWKEQEKEDREKGRSGH